MFKILPVSKCICPKEINNYIVQVNNIPYFLKCLKLYSPLLETFRHITMSMSKCLFQNLKFCEDSLASVRVYLCSVACPDTTISDLFVASRVSSP